MEAGIDMAKILVVDDEEEFADLVAMRLRLGAHHQVLTAYDGESALRQAWDELPDLIVLDIMMPKMDGHEVFKRLRNNPSSDKIPVLFLTALSPQLLALQNLDFPRCDYLLKPFEPEAFDGKVKRLLAGL